MPDVVKAIVRITSMAGEGLLRDRARADIPNTLQDSCARKSQPLQAFLGSTSPAVDWLRDTREHQGIAPVRFAGSKSRWRAQSAVRDCCLSQSARVG